MPGSDGQTGSGKTHTVMGTTVSETGDDQRGMIPRAIGDIFSTLEQERKDKEDGEFALRVSYLELYNEAVFDLLDDQSKQKKPSAQWCGYGTPIRATAPSGLTVKEVKGKFVVKGLKEVVVESPEHLHALVKKGNSARTVAASNQNTRSSRSHAVLTFYIEKTVPLPHEAGMEEAQPSVITSKLNLVDLAGSEKMQTSSTNETRGQETRFINRSLHNLSRVIQELSTGNSHVPYRDSTLTRLLMDSLGGNAITAMIACIHVNEQNAQETHSTLSYANQAKNIKNKPVVNQTSDDCMINKLHAEIGRLQLLVKQKEVLNKHCVSVLQYINEESAGDDDAREMGPEAAAAGMGAALHSPAPTRWAHTRGNSVMLQGVDMEELQALQQKDWQLRKRLSMSPEVIREDGAAPEAANATRAVHERINYLCSLLHTSPDRKRRTVGPAAAPTHNRQLSIDDQALKVIPQPLQEVAGQNKGSTEHRMVKQLARVLKMVSTAKGQRKKLEQVRKVLPHLGREANKHINAAHQDLSQATRLAAEQQAKLEEMEQMIDLLETTGQEQERGRQEDATRWQEEKAELLASKQELQEQQRVTQAQLTEEQTQRARLQQQLQQSREEAAELSARVQRHQTHVQEQVAAAQRYKTEQAQTMARVRQCHAQQMEEAAAQHAHARQQQQSALEASQRALSHTQEQLQSTAARAAELQRREEQALEQVKLLTQEKELLQQRAQQAETQYSESDELRRQLEQEHQTRLQHMQQAHAAALTELTTEARERTQSHEQQLRQVQQHQQRQAAALRQELAELRAQLHEAEEQAGEQQQRLRERHAQELQETHSAHTQELGRMQAAAAQQCQALEAQAQEDQQSREQQLWQVRQAHSGALQQLQEEHTQALRELDAQHQRDLDRLTASVIEAETLVSQKAEQHQAQVTAVLEQVAQRDEQLNEVQQDHEALQEQIRVLQQAVQQQRQEQAALKTRAQQVQEQHKERLASLQQQWQAEREQAQAEKKLLQEQCTQLQAQQQAARQQLQQARASLERARASQVREFAQCSAVFVSRAQAQQRELEDWKQQVHTLTREMEVMEKESAALQKHAEGTHAVMAEQAQALQELTELQREQEQKLQAERARSAGLQEELMALMRGSTGAGAGAGARGSAAVLRQAHGTLSPHAAAAEAAVPPCAASLQRNAGLVSRAAAPVVERVANGQAHTSAAAQGQGQGNPSVSVWLQRLRNMASRSSPSSVAESKELAKTAQGTGARAGARAGAAAGAGQWGPEDEVQALGTILDHVTASKTALARSTEGEMSRMRSIISSLRRALEYRERQVAQLLEHGPLASAVSPRSRHAYMTMPEERGATDRRG